MGERADNAENSQLGLPGVGVERLVLRGPGRPPGAEARSKKQLREHLAALGYRDPAMVLAETMSMSETELQRVVNRHDDGTLVPEAERISRFEAKAMKLKAAAELMPYLHGKMPTVELQPDEKLPLLILELGTNQLDIDRGRIDGGQSAAPLSIGAPVEENQGVSAGDARQSHGATVSRSAETEER